MRELHGNELCHKAPGKRYQLNVWIARHLYHPLPQLPPMVPKWLIRPDGDCPGAIQCRYPWDGALNHDRGPVAPVGRLPFSRTLVRVYLMCG